MFRLNKIKNQGFTLFELLVSMILLGVISLGIVVIHISGQKRFLIAEKKSTLLNQTNYAIDHITKNTRECTNIINVANGEVQLQSRNGEIITYRRTQDGKVFFIQSGKPQEILSNNISLLNFTQSTDPATNLQVLGIQITAEDAEKNISITLSQSVTLRNSF